jgi:hypothetical protein
VGRNFGKAKGYVDDFLAVTRRKYGAEVHEAVLRVMGLLGSKAHNSKMDRAGRKLDWIGWEVDLDLRVVSLALKNFNNTLCGFLSVSTDRPMSLKNLDTLCSWSARYTLVLRVLAPLTSMLYAEKKGLGRTACIFM